MKNLLLPGATIGLALLITGCETDGGVTTRIQEKSSAYATLQPWEKKDIAKGVVATGFTADMVYMALGNPSKVEPVNEPEGNVELWTYRNYYPPTDAAHMQLSGYNAESPYQPSRTEYTTIKVDGDQGKPGNIPLGTGRSPASISATGPPQGQQPEPADLQVFTFKVLFQKGKVIRLALSPT